MNMTELLNGLQVKEVEASELLNATHKKLFADKFHIGNEITNIYKLPNGIIYNQYSLIYIK